MEQIFDEDSQGVTLIKLEPNFEEDSLDAPATNVDSEQRSNDKNRNGVTKRSPLLKYGKRKTNVNVGDETATMVICDICKKAFKSKIYLKKHLKWHMKKKPSDDEQYRQFIADNFDMNCDQCHAVFTTFHDARRHYKIKHNEKKGYIKCCSVKLNEFWLVIDHINSQHLNPKTFKCDLCNKTFSDRKRLYLHKRRHKQAITLPFICHHCGKHFRNKEVITRHLFTTHVNSEPKFECEICHKRFQLATLLKNHCYAVHREKKANVTCEKCGKTFNLLQDLVNHMQMHTDKSIRLAQRKQCKYCNAWLLTRSGIYYHTTIHSNRVQKCEHCKMELPNRLALLQHIRKYHRAPKHRCDLCAKTFEIPSKLREHEESHTRHNIYSCDYCPKKFSLSSSRQTHMRRHHPEQLKERKQLRKMLQLKTS